MKKGWEIKHLGEIVDVLDNLRKPITKRDRIDGEFPYYGATGILSFVHNYIFSEKLVLIGEDGAKWASGDNTSFIANGKYWVNNHAHVIRPNRTKVLDEWIVYFLNFSDLTPFISGMTVPKLNQEKMRSIPIPLPPLSEQQRIVFILDECFAAIDQAKANAEKNLENARELFESYLERRFEVRSEGWTNTRLGDICEITDGTHFSPKNVSEGEFMYITAKNIKPYYIDLSNISYVSRKDHTEIYSRCSPKKGDVLYIKDGATAGIATINSLDVEFSMLSSVALLKCSDKILNSFLVHYMNSAIGKKNFLGYVDGAAITRLTLVKIKNVNLPLPSLLEQHNIVQKSDSLLAETQKLAGLYRKKIEDLEELKKSILQKAFSGELSTGKTLTKELAL